MSHMNRISANEYALDAPNGAHLRLVRHYGWWHVCNTRGGSFAAFGTLPAARRFALTNFA